MPETQETNRQPEKKGFWANLSIFQKIIIAIIIIAIVLIGYNTLVKGIKSVWELFFILLFVGFLCVVGFVVLGAMDLFFRKKYYSPKEDYVTRLVNHAIDLCSPDLGNLFFLGSRHKKMVNAGKIIGCIGIPYLVGKQKLDSSGNPIFIESKYFNGKKMPVYDSIHYGEEGDTLFIVTKPAGFLGLFPKKLFIRCDRELHGELSGDVIIEDINPVPYGKFFSYPFKQIQKDSERVMVQNMLEVILQTFEHQSDLISMSADAGIYYNPYFKLVEKTNAEKSMEG